MAMYFGIFSGPITTALLVLGQRQLFADLLNPTSIGGAFNAIVSISLLAFLIFQLLWMTQGKAETSGWEGPGKVLLFPCRTSHSRKFPRRHSFSFPYLVVGIPVAFEGTAAGMVSVGSKGKHRPSPWLPAAAHRGWFTIDAGDYLERGKSGLGLQEKLAEYLRTQGVNPATYPYAYLVTAARFLGYHFNPVSFWYLYDADMRLAAMILEVNNASDERRMYLLRVDCSDRARRADYPPGSIAREAENAKAPFKQSWPKDFHVSPFNSRKGSYTVVATDPLGPFLQGTGPLSTTITLISSKGHPKMVADLSSTGGAIDPCTMTAFQKYRFLASWWWVGFFTFPRILTQAFRLFFQHQLRVWHRPEPLKGTISRRANPTEEQLEPIFRRYLQHQVEQSATPLSVTYYHPAITNSSSSSSSGNTTPHVFLSPAARAQTPSSPDPNPNPTNTVENIDLHVLTPAFYTRFSRHAHRGLEAAVRELQASGTIWVSRPDLLGRLFALAKPPPSVSSGPESPSAGWWDKVCFWAIRRLRMSSQQSGGRTGRGEGEEEMEGVPGKGSVVGMSGMDAYVLGYESARERRVYWRCVMSVLLAERIAFGSVALLGVQRVLVQACFVWLLSAAVSSVMVGMVRMATSESM